MCDLMSLQEIPVFSKYRISFKYSSIVMDNFCLLPSKIKRFI